jgi:hypothetical protein
MKVVRFENRKGPKRKKEKNPIKGGGNVDMWHDHMYVHYTLVAT